MRSRRLGAMMGGGALLLSTFPTLPGRAAPEHPPSLSATYRALAERLVKRSLEQGQSFDMLQHLTDRIGPRLSGSPGAEAAVRWTAERLRQDGLTVTTEPVLVPHWVRGVESAELLAPARRNLSVTALGGSVPTPAAGITGELVEVQGFEQLAALGSAGVTGRIVFFNHDMSSSADYRRLSPLRTRGASEAARYGAVASVVRSLGTLAARLPHTGAVVYDEAARIPAAALAAEDADLIHRLIASGQKPALRLVLGCQTLPDAPSANVVAQLAARERSGEIVLIGAHLDSWDLGEGAIDNGAGVAMVMETLRLLAAEAPPRRAIRGVLFMNEENGGRGGRGYAEAHATELSRHVAALESDGGAGRPQALLAAVGPGGVEILRELVSLVRPLGMDDVSTRDTAGGDIAHLRRGQVPLLLLRQDSTRYFDWHHTAADTLDKVDRQELARNAAAMAIIAYVLADMPQPLPRPGPPASPAPGQ